MPVALTVSAVELKNHARAVLHIRQVLQGTRNRHPIDYHVIVDLADVAPLRRAVGSIERVDRACQSALDRDHVRLCLKPRQRGVCFLAIGDHNFMRPRRSAQTRAHGLHALLEHRRTVHGAQQDRDIDAVASCHAARRWLRWNLPRNPRAHRLQIQTDQALAVCAAWRCGVVAERVNFGILPEPPLADVRESRLSQKTRQALFPEHLPMPVRSRGR